MKLFWMVPPLTERTSNGASSSFTWLKCKIEACKPEANPLLRGLLTSGLLDVLPRVSICRVSQLTPVWPCSCHPSLKAVNRIRVSKGYKRPKNVPPIVEEAEENTQCASVSQINLLIVLHCPEICLCAVPRKGSSWK